jgi:pyridoxamine-phosphate oxidase
LTSSIIQRKIPIMDDKSIVITDHNQYYTSERLSPDTMARSPFEQFRIWFAEAVENRVHEPEAMSVATATPSGIPSTRVVLFKQLDSRGFVFFTNYASRKSRELQANPHAALSFYWREMYRAVRVVGRVEKVSKKENEEYFSGRPVESQLGAWASRQSEVVGEGELRARFDMLKERFATRTPGGEDGEVRVPVPDFWGGWRVIPE